ncbi:hypothetical protein RB195_013232 [Necator americanus]|uniref:Reverse transcriptase domain-containing protein n=1 Tax=Necator americanus TaxID=51031 RepID=A0ABR1DV77_NECAM
MNSREISEKVKAMIMSEVHLHSANQGTKSMHDGTIIQDKIGESIVTTTPDGWNKFIMYPEGFYANYCIGPLYSECAHDDPEVENILSFGDMVSFCRTLLPMVKGAMEGLWLLFPSCRESETISMTSRAVSLWPRTEVVLSNLRLDRLTSVAYRRTPGTALPSVQRTEACMKIDHIHIVSKLIEVSREHKMPLCLTFVDLNKAFGSVETEAVMKALDNHTGISSIGSAKKMPVPASEGDLTRRPTWYIGRKTYDRSQ